MKGVLALGLVGASTAFAQQTAAPAVPPWLYIVATVVGSGVFLRYYTARVEKRLKETLADNQAEGARKTSVDRQETLDRIQREVLAEWETRLDSMRVDLHQAEADRAALKAQLAEASAEMARKDTKIQFLSHRIEALHDELLTTRAELGLIERRDPPTP